MDDRNNNNGAADSTENESPQFFGSTQEVVDRYTHCTLCGSNLHFSHSTDFTRNITQETAKCPECGIKAHAVMHRLQ